MKDFLQIFLLLISLNVFAHELTCSTHGSSGEMKLVVHKPTEFYNGVVNLTGFDLLKHLESLIKGLDINCLYANCSMQARIVLQERTVFVGGQSGPGFVAYREGNGLKLFTTLDGKMDGRNWFFNECH